MLTGYTYIFDKYVWLGGAFDDLKTTGSAPATSGTTALLITDEEGKPSFLSDGLNATLNVVFNGGGSDVQVGLYVDAQIPYNSSITKVSLFSNDSGSTSIDILKDTFANYPPTSSITSASKPQLINQRSYEDTTLSGWTTSISEDDILRFVVGENSGITAMTLAIKLKKE